MCILRKLSNYADLSLNKPDLYKNKKAKDKEDIMETWNVLGSGR